MARREPLLVDDLGDRLRGQRVGDGRIAPQTAMLFALGDEAEGKAVGALVLGVHPRLPFDADHREFLSLAAETIASRVAEAQARQRERERLAELDRAKTEFFSNVSHEFRTPLTLMMDPLDAALEHSGALPPQLASELATARRNARRLLRLTGTLLDFSQLEAGRLHADFAPTDLATATREIGAQFRSANELAGLALHVAAEPLGEPVWVDAEMWERIVSNLISNALKFTFEGEIEVTLRRLPKHAELVVRDTGVGIEQDELPFIFKRFHRVRGTRAGTLEGAGIGLALVDELVRRHHGRIRATSTVGAGTTFTVWIPLGARLRRESGPDRGKRETTAVAAAMAEAAERWSADPEPPRFPQDDPLDGVRPAPTSTWSSRSPRASWWPASAASSRLHDCAARASAACARSCMPAGTSSTA